MYGNLKKRFEKCSADSQAGNHQFEARYDEQPNLHFKNVSLERGDPHSILYYKVYVHDICTRCGRTVRRQSP